MYIEELSRKYRPDHFLSYILRSVLKTCWNYRGKTVLEFDFETKDGGPFLMLRFEIRPVILDMLEIWRADQILCFVSRSALSLGMLEIQRWDHILFDLRF